MYFMIIKRINQKKKGPTYGCPQVALEIERKGDVQHSQADEEQIAQSSHWPRLVENLPPARHYSKQQKLNAERKLGVEVESWILDEDAKPVDETYQGHATPAREIQLSLPRPVVQRFVGVVFEYPAHDRNECYTQPNQVPHFYHSFQGAFSVATLRQMLAVSNSDNTANIAYTGLKVKPNRKSLYLKAFSRFLYWIKKFWDE